MIKEQENTLQNKSSGAEPTGITVFSIKKELYYLGLSTFTTPFGRKIKVYNMERAICDMLRNRNQMDIAILTDALKRYVK